jgi:NosR/NirI family nitrous oxide reductase transcriptional regulator
MQPLRALVLLAIMAAVPCAAEQNFPPPEFTTGYQMPTPTAPAARPPSLALVDIIVLAVALILASYFALKARSRRELAILSVFSLLYFGFYRHGCVCPVGAVQNVALALSPTPYTLPLVVAAFFLLPILFTLLFGRVFCGTVCPLGAAQEAVLLRPVRVPAWVESALGIIPFLYLGIVGTVAACGGLFLVCHMDPFVLFFRLGGDPHMLIIGVLVLLLSVFVGRPYCRFLCPYGALLRVLAPLARWPVKTTPTECINCHLCASACPYEAIRPPTPEGQGGERREGKRRLTMLLVLLPVLLIVGAVGGRFSAPILARTNEAVSLADRVWSEEHGRVKGKTEASKAFDQQGVPSQQLYAEAARVRKRFDLGGMILGAYLGLVVGLRLIGLSVRRRRESYETDPAACVACGRCFAYCPVSRSQFPDSV